MARAYQRPVGQFIGRNAKKLYALEEKRNDAIKAAATELGKVLGKHPENFWTDIMPEALLSILESFDRNAARLAAEVFLEKEAAKDAHFGKGVPR